MDNETRSSLARSRERVGERVSTDRRPDSVDDAVELLEDLLAVEAHHGDAQRFELSTSSQVIEPLVIAVVVGAIDFDSDPRLGAEKVDDEVPNWMLASELLAPYLAASQTLPEPGLGSRRVPPLVTSAFANVPIGCSVMCFRRPSSLVDSLRRRASLVTPSP